MFGLFGVSNIQLRLWVAVGMTATAFVTVFGSEILSTHHSNACDPGLERFKYLQSDPAMQSKPAHALLMFEWDQPDNSFTGCSESRVSYTMFGPDKHAIFQDANQALISHGWSSSPPIPGNENWDVHERQSPYGTLTAIVNEDLAWVSVSMYDNGGTAIGP